MQRVGKVAFKRKSFLKRNPTEAEKIIRQFLKEHGINHSFQKLVFTKNKYYIVDFIVQMKPRTIIEIDGATHNGKEKEDAKRIKDIVSLKPYKKYDWNILRIKNEDVFNGKAFDIIKELYKNSGSKRHF